MRKKILVCGGGGFIGHHLVNRLKQEGNWVCAADLVRPRHGPSPADVFKLGNLADRAFVEDVFDVTYDEVYQFAAEMGGAGFIFTGAHDATIMQTSMSINLNALQSMQRQEHGRIFFASSACVYPRFDATAQHLRCREADVYPAMPDSDYGWEKLFAERVYDAYARNHNVIVRIARLHNIIGPECAWDNGREKAPAALCRKIARSGDGQPITIWGDGEQIRSFLAIDDCLDGIIRLMRSNVTVPVNIGSDQAISIDALADMVADIAGKAITKIYIDGPTGVDVRCSDNSLVGELLHWQPKCDLRGGLEQTYHWIAGEIAAGRTDSAPSAA